MATAQKKLFDAALALPVEQRAELAERLLESLESDELPPVSEAWLREIERRIENFRLGKTKAVVARKHS